jgi:hypothetical protein
MLRFARFYEDFKDLEHQCILLNLYLLFPYFSGNNSKNIEIHTKVLKSGFWAGSRFNNLAEYGSGYGTKLKQKFEENFRPNATIEQNFVKGVFNISMYLSGSTQFHHSLPQDCHFHEHLPFCNETEIYKKIGVQIWLKIRNGA